MLPTFNSVLIALSNRYFIPSSHCQDIYLYLCISFFLYTYSISSHLPTYLFTSNGPPPSPLSPFKTHLPKCVKSGVSGFQGLPPWHFRHVGMIASAQCGIFGDMLAFLFVFISLLLSLLHLYSPSPCAPVCYLIVLSLYFV